MVLIQFGLGVELALVDEDHAEPGERQQGAERLRNKKTHAIKRDVLHRKKDCLTPQRAHAMRTLLLITIRTVMYCRCFQMLARAGFASDRLLRVACETAIHFQFSIRRFLFFKNSVPPLV